MKRDWRIWKGLKQSETGLGCDYITGKLDCSNEWWEIKIKEKPEAKKFRNKGVPCAIEELWDQLYSDVVANGLECVTPGMNPSSVVVNDVQSGNVERVQAGVEEEETNSEERVLGEYEDSQDHVYSEYSQYSSHLENLERSEGTFWHEFSNEVLNADNQQPNQSQGVTQVPTSDRRTSKEPQKTATKTVNSVPMKRKRRQSTGSAMMNHHLENMVAFCGRAVQALESDASAPDSVTNTQTPVNCAVMVMNVLKNMDGLENGSALWCYAVYLLEDAMRRDFFFAMEDDASRLAWLKFMYDMKDK
ncbi:uncharacterized protein LOC109820987 [Asparagus officinalis]|uniref:uncharacterized protein LOC109820987 n=1 Tax=Asparagus officinalis TaxID=4686 RepID=UPI00098E4B76|nr:uncharacterized protein LOC109820987 [Asparagus officinalis]